MDNLQLLMRNEESVARNCFQAVSSAFSNCLEKCDNANLKQPLYAYMEQLLASIGDMYTSPDKVLAQSNKESREIFLVNYCSAAQPLLYALGNDYISDELIHKIV